MQFVRLLPVTLSLKVTGIGLSHPWLHGTLVKQQDVIQICFLTSSA